MKELNRVGVIEATLALSMFERGVAKYVDKELTMYCKAAKMSDRTAIFFACKLLSKRNKYPEVYYYGFFHVRGYQNSF